ncbi:penicillin-binding protein 1B [Vibrio sp. UCD-FRSSP16_10]|uniref:penicillin-binding protein 1B n=1 Tax=unclassified Vibrio TaxID=2614977 RepID=UPI0007FECADE|nr:MULTISPECIES: penicillin-binding protein 1B [unclassified Vibrio]OBT17281.1 penicillin-binding protein 1B [Vibrio sp. UCD-FRSSP16_30]OBT23050.1 penicillin-binding protein 1B [Vibrio sp. UCD-FRSSP16_10]
MPEKRTPPKTRQTKKPQAKKTPAKKARPKKNKINKKPSTSWVKKIWSIGWKVGLTGIAVLAFVMVYLNTVVERRFDGQLFDLPTIVYARILNLAPGTEITHSQMLKELDVLHYRKVQSPKFPGEYSASNSKIELIRRPFDFQDGAEPERHVMLSFDSNSVTKIQSLEKKGELGFLRLEPKMLGMLEKDVTEQRLFVKRRDYPEFLVDALLTTEDRDFYHHDGVSPTAIARAFIVNIKAGRAVQGGSTLTQQLSKNLFLTQEKTLWRKVREALIAIIIDHRYDKDRILEAYLNEVYLGQSAGQAIHGFGLAARFYFGQPIQELRIDQLAMLVGLVKGPSYYNPIRHPQRSKNRRDLILKLLLEKGVLDSGQYQQAISRDLDLQKTPRIASRQPAYFQQLKNELNQYVGGDFEQHSGLRLFTTLDPVSQSMLEKAVTETLPRLEKGKPDKLESAAIAVDRRTGEIRAMVGGRRTGYDGFNRALNASRQIGSLVKPAVYLTALMQPDKYQLASTLVDEPISLKGNKGSTWTPRNFDRKFRGNVPLYRSLAHSLNVPTVRLGMTLGMKNVQNTIESLGVDEDEVRPLPSMFLGAFTLTPYQVAQMYQSLTNSGRKVPLSALRVVKNQDDEIIYQSFPRAQQVVPEQAAWLATYAMKKVVSEGSGRYLSAHFSRYSLAGKTGTSNDGRDSWFVGVDGREVVTLWVGRDDNQSAHLTGSSGAVRVYADYLKHREPEVLSLPWPQGIRTLGYRKQADGSLAVDCNSQFKLPVWDESGQALTDCQSNAKPWFKKILPW